MLMHSGWSDAWGGGRGEGGGAGGRNLGGDIASSPPSANLEHVRSSVQLLSQSC